MRIDVVSIFPEYLAPLELSLIGKARQDGILDLHVHDLRNFTTDKHRSVDDTPYGGGAGMVMKPEPWAQALTAVAEGRPDPQRKPVLIVPSPAGERFTQALAYELAEEQHLAFACGRYEGIDERVIEWAQEHFTVRPVSLGDYVLNGGEVAVLAMVEAIGRLLPGVVGNPESLVEESHSDGLLEYPVYTKPASWRGHDVPPVLLSGDHGRIAAWRRQLQRERTATRRPDLLHASAAETTWRVQPATRGDAAELLTLQRACWVQEALANDSLDIPALHESLADVEESIATWDTYVVRSAGRLVGAVRGRLDGDAWDIGRLMVAPDLQGRGLGRVLLEHIQAVAPAQASTYSLFTGAASARNQRLYKKAGFRLRPELAPVPGVVVMTKRVRRSA